LKIIFLDGEIFESFHNSSFALWWGKNNKTNEKILQFIYSWVNCFETKGEKGKKKKRKKKNPNHEPQILRRNSCPNVARPRKAVVVCLTSSAAIANFGLCARTSLPVYSSFLSSLGICCCEEVPVTDFWIGIWWSPLELSTSFCESSRGFFNQVWSAVYRLLNPPDPCLFVCFLRLTAVVLLVLFCSVLFLFRCFSLCCWSIVCV